MLYNSPVGASLGEEVKSVSNGFTFRHDLVSREECKIGLDFLCDEIGRRLRKKSLKCTTVALTIKDVYLHCIQRQRTLLNHTDVSREISSVAYDILCEEWAESKPIRMLTVAVSGLVDASSSFVQLDLFADPDDKSHLKGKKREETVDAIRKKYGMLSISTGAIIDSDIGVFESEKENGT